jgi:hypothetical protein
MPPKKEGEKHFYGFDSSGLEKAAAVSNLYSIDPFKGSQIP